MFTYVEKEKFAVGEECFPSAVMCVDASGRTKGLRISEAVQYEDAGAVFGDVLVGMRFDVYPEAVKFGC